MGLGLGSKSSSTFDKGCSKVYYSIQKNVVVNLPNPDPNNYNIIKVEEFGKSFVIEIQYPDCTNYEGRKILVYHCSLSNLLNQKTIDPHFSNNKKFYSPVARFEPTKRGWRLARVVAKELERA